VTDPAALVDELRRVGTAAGLAAVGVTPARPWTHTRGVLESRRAQGLVGTMAFTYRRPARSSDPTRILKHASSLVVGAWPYARPAPPHRPGTARVARYAARDEYAGLRTALETIAARLREAGHRTVVVADDNALVDREAAWRAGIGFYGKNANLLLPGRGSWFVLGAVVTDAHLPPTGPPVPEECGACRRCLDGCPTGAIVAPGVVDARRCLSWILQQPGPIPVEFREALGDRVYGCDDCQEVCPPSRRTETAVNIEGGDGGGIGTATGTVAAPGIGDPPAGSDDPALLDAVELLAADDDEILRRCGRWYLPGRDPNIVRRNLLVVLGNEARPDHRVRAAVDRYLDHPDPVLSSHARWAADRIAGRLARVAVAEQDG
jgi:epoxyqueuosine reductase